MKTKTKNAKANELRKLVGRLNEMVVDLLDDLADASSDVPKLKPREKSVKKLKKIKSARAVRCKHVDVVEDSSGGGLARSVGCQARSKGPRFHYLCEKHQASSTANNETEAGHA